METVEIYLDNPIILDVVDAGLELISENEVFCELPEPEYAGYYISNYARLYSAKSGRLLTPQMIGDSKKEQLRPAYYLQNKFKHSRAVRIAGLVAKVFCRNNYPDEKTCVHHKSGDVRISSWDELEIVPYSVHNSLHFGISVALYDNNSGELEVFPTIKALSEHLGIHRNVIGNALYDIRRGK